MARTWIKVAKGIWQWPVPDIQWPRVSDSGVNLDYSGQGHLTMAWTWCTVAKDIWQWPEPDVQWPRTSDSGLNLMYSGQGHLTVAWTWCTVAKGIWQWPEPDVEWPRASDNGLNLMYSGQGHLTMACTWYTVAKGICQWPGPDIQWPRASEATESYAAIYHVSNYLGLITGLECFGPQKIMDRNDLGMLTWHVLNQGISWPKTFWAKVYLGSKYNLDLISPLIYKNRIKSNIQNVLLVYFMATKSLDVLVWPSDYLFRLDITLI